ncbi:hypothetical protein WJX81_007538 [Elliptochloris bilobata]|uniref:Uncharacterized protein n=1 Tax=Elliptochloris bilobata TaxID=381761 RepID=A0AAW1QY37_9CHLO
MGAGTRLAIPGKASQRYGMGGLIDAHQPHLRREHFNAMVIMKLLAATEEQQLHTLNILHSVEWPEKKHPPSLIVLITNKMKAGKKVAQCTAVPGAAGGWPRPRWLQQQLGPVEMRGALQLLQFASSVVFVCLYVASTYSAPAPFSLRYNIDILLCLLFAFEYVARIVEAENKLRMVTSLWNVLDFLAIFPPLVELVLLHGANVPFTLGRLDLRWFKILRALRVMRLSLLAGELNGMHLSSSGALLSGAASIRLLQLVASVLTLLFTTSSIVHLVERIPFHDALYFVTTTLTTVGYGDVVAQSNLGKLAVLAMICVGVVLIPVQTSALYAQLTARRVTLGALPEYNEAVVLVSTRLSEVRGFSDFFTEFQTALLKTRMPRRVRMVVLCSRPNYELRAFQELNDRRLTLYEGSALSERDLVRTRAESASAVLLLADRFSPSVHHEDLSIQFQVWAIKSYTKSAPLYVQVLQRSSLSLISPFLDPERDVIVSVEQTRHRLLALSCLCPGASTLIANLLRRAAISATEKRHTAAGRRWLRNYLNGCAFKIFEAPLPAHLAGLPFTAACEWMYRTSGCVLIGMRSRGVVLNPGRRPLDAGQTAIVVASSQAAVDAALQLRFSWPAALPASPPAQVDLVNVGMVTEDGRPCELQLPEGLSLESDSVDLDDVECVPTMSDDGSTSALPMLANAAPTAGGNGAAASVAAAASAVLPSTGLLAGAAPYKIFSRAVADGGAAGGGANSGEWTSRREGNAAFLHTGIERQSLYQFHGPASAAAQWSMRQAERNFSDGVAERVEPPEPQPRGPLGKLEDHVIICGSESAFVNFAEQMRRCDADRRTPVVVLHERRPDDAVWGALEALGPTLFCKGEPSDGASLAAARAAHARALVYLAHPQRPMKEVGEATMVDSSFASRVAVLADAQGLRTAYGVGEQSGGQLTNSIVELCFTSSVRFLQPGLLLKGAAGSVEEGVGGIDSLAGKPRKSWQMRKRQERAAIKEGLAEWQANPYFCAGRVTVPAVMDTFASTTFLKGAMLTELMTELAGDDGRPGGALLRQVEVPAALVGRTYGDLFAYLVLQRQLVPLGLYRKKPENPAWRLSYVQTNPPAQERVLASDRAFVLRTHFMPVA